MPVPITRAQRDAIYEMVIMHLSAIGDVWLSVKRRDFADAKEMGGKARSTRPTNRRPSPDSATGSVHRCNERSTMRGARLCQQVPRRSRISP